MSAICNCCKAIVFFLLITSEAQALPIDYDESLDGDLAVSSFIYYGEAFTFSAGVNKISGQMTVGLDVVDFDHFFFIVPDDMRLESITYSFSVISNVNGYSSSAGAGYVLRNGIDNSYLGSAGRVDVLNTSGPVQLYKDNLPYSSDFTGLLPLEPNVYLLGHSLFAGSGAGRPYLVTWDYSIEFEVSATASVPEPPTIVILLFGLLFIATKYSASKSSNLARR